MASISCVLFDLYGTLVDLRLNEDSPVLWEGLRSVVASSGGADARADEVRRRFAGLLQQEAERGAEGFLLEPTFRRLLASFGARDDDLTQVGRAFRQLSIQEISIRPYVAPVFDALRLTKCRIGIVSNTEAVLTRSDLERFPILLSADTVVLSSEVGVRKPDPAIFRIALERLHLPADAAVVVGNSVADDVDGARRAGLRAIYVDDRAVGVEPMIEQQAFVLRAEPTLEALTLALQRFGWRPACLPQGTP
jgi:putative hydrolase of the HAD superfamily